MNVLDENVIESQRQLLRKWRMRFRQIGVDFGRAGIQDADIIRLLHQTGGVTFFTRDDDFFDCHLCHRAYCLVTLDVGQYEAASFVRRVLRHPALRTKALRMGKVVVASHSMLRCHFVGVSKAEFLSWPQSTNPRPK